MSLCQYYWTDAHIRDIGLDYVYNGCALNTWYNCVKLGDGEEGWGQLNFSPNETYDKCNKGSLDDQFSLKFYNSLRSLCKFAQTPLRAKASILMSPMFPFCFHNATCKFVFPSQNVTNGTTTGAIT